jgi:hypothetical protein
MNCDFASSDSVRARYSLKQLWEESCSKADNIGAEAVKEPEKHLILFRQYCNQRKKSIIPTNKENHQVNIPLTQGRYAGQALIVFNTPHVVGAIIFNLSITSIYCP